MNGYDSSILSAVWCTMRKVIISRKIRADTERGLVGREALVEGAASVDHRRRV